MALFDTLKTPEQILAERNRAAQPIIQASENPALTGLGQALGDIGSSLFGRAIGVDLDPELTKARAAQGVLDEIRDFDLEDPAQLREASGRFRAVGALDQSDRLRERASEVETTGLKNRLLEQNVRIAEETTGKKVPTDTRASLQKNLESAGFTPGTPEYRAAVLDAISKKGKTTVNISQSDGQRRDQFMATQVTDAVQSMQTSLNVDSFDPTTVDKKVVDSFGSWGNFAKSDAWQAFEGDNDLSVEMFLNKTTGAAYTPEQKSSAEKRFKINPGDKQSTIKLKLRRIVRLRDALVTSSGLSAEEFENLFPDTESESETQPAPVVNRFEGFSIVQ